MSGSQNPMSAVVAKRLAAAADGHRNGKPVYFVADLQDLGEVESFEGEGAKEAAERASRERAARGGTRPAVFGPYLTEPDPASAAAPKPEVLDVTVRVRLPDGTTRTETFDGGELDAIFWTRSAVDKFVVPYYAGTLGLQYATRLSNQFAAENVYMLAHLPDTVIRPVRVAADPSRDPER